MCLRRALRMHSIATRCYLIIGGVVLIQISAHALPVFEAWTFHTLHPSDFTPQNTFIVLRANSNPSSAIVGFIVLDNCTTNSQLLIRYPVFALEPRHVLSLFRYALCEMQRRERTAVYLVVPLVVARMLDSALDSNAVTAVLRCDDPYEGTVVSMTREMFVTKQKKCWVHAKL
eukprot:TRINITY_DN1532_c0_g1_i1.p1 TRINITY_DN1532_c0_g1~~TRINITY_DN1532_c0_g1_i1.p1  ORF type:complete len:173 (-),score=25.78 TRINITY_DN1532_c0_g1_i1:1031-1549(-)